MIAYIGLGIAALGLILGTGYFVASLLTVEEPISNRLVEPGASHSPVPWGKAFKRMALALFFFFVVGTAGLTTFIVTL